MASTIYSGSSTWGSPILTIDSGNVYTGSSTWGSIMAIVDKIVFTRAHPHGEL